MVDTIDTTTDPATAAGSAEVKAMASPWVLGLYGLAGATFVVFAHWAGWFGGPQSAAFLFPLAGTLGGLMPILAAMWAYTAHDALATAMLGAWGAFWIGYAFLTGMIAMGKVAVPGGAFPELAYWFIPMAAITWMGAAAARRVSPALVTVFTLLAAGATLAAIGEGCDVHGITVLAAWIFIVGAVCAWYTATVTMFGESFPRDMLAFARHRMPGRATAQHDVLHPTSHRAG